jgi:predicted ABC-type ATPase
VPDLYLIGGAGAPSGSRAGKTTVAMTLLPDFLGCYEYVNADSIAAGLSPFKPESVALQAGRLMLERLHSLSTAGVDFAFETTLASRSFAPFLMACREKEYAINLLYIWLESVELAIQRVAARVRNGGHSIPEATIGRRYELGRRNFMQLYMPLADFWKVYDNSGDSPLLVAQAMRDEEAVVYSAEQWDSIVGE